MPKLAKMGITNSSPIISLQRIGRLELLGGHFARLLAPEQVGLEVGGLPGFVEPIPAGPPDIPFDFPSSIHPGEAAVLALAARFSGAMLVIDDRPAREHARRMGFRVIGTLGLVVECKHSGRIDQAGPVLDDLRHAGFRISDALYLDVLRLAGEDP